MIGMYFIYVYSECARFETNQYEFALIDCLYFGCIGIVHMGSHNICIHPILDKMIFPIYFDGTSKNDYRDAMYVLNRNTTMGLGGKDKTDARTF
jgi:hypothetical protein